MKGLRTSHTTKTGNTGGNEPENHSTRKQDQGHRLKYLNVLMGRVLSVVKSEQSSHAESGRR